VRGQQMTDASQQDRGDGSLEARVVAGFVPDTELLVGIEEHLRRDVAPKVGVEDDCVR